MLPKPEAPAAIVTGGGWNIGRAVALALGRAGYRVAVAARRRSLLEETVALLEEAGASGLAVPTDVTRPEEAERLIRQTFEQFGRLDVVACLAGGYGAGQPLDETDPAEWIDVVHRNLIGTYLVTRAALPALRARGQGDIITCAGGGAFFPMVGAYYTAYAAAKAAVCRFTDQLAAELLGTGIRVNCIEPGLVLPPEELDRLAAEEARTGHPHPLRAQHRPPEAAAELVLFLLSEAGRPLNGRLLSVNDRWWRDPEAVRRVAAGDAYRLRRVEE